MKSLQIFFMLWGYTHPISFFKSCLLELVEWLKLPSKLEALNSNPNATKKKETGF
jgi:hypothetical protein